MVAHAAAEVDLVGVVGGVARMSPLLMLSERWRLALPPIAIVGSEVNKVDVIGFFFNPIIVLVAEHRRRWGRGRPRFRWKFTAHVTHRISRKDTVNREQWCACVRACACVCVCMLNVYKETD